MKYYSEILDAKFDTEDALVEAETAFNKEREEKELAAKAKKEEREKDYAELKTLKENKTNAYSAYLEEAKKYTDALNAFAEKYKGYHITYYNFDNINNINKFIEDWTANFNKFWDNF